MLPLASFKVSTLERRRQRDIFFLSKRLGNTGDFFFFLDGLEEDSHVQMYRLALVTTRTHVTH